VRALSVLAEQAGVVEDDITRRYENWFIETCDEWVVPYIGDLLGVGGLHQLPGASAFSQRARVANTLAHRRRKGTATMLEQLARDTTGWNARTVEFFELLSTTQHFNHVRLLNHRTADLRQAGKLELLNTPFDTIAHTADVRHIASTRGRHNVPNVGVHLWRLQAYAVTESDARGVGNPADRSFTFDPAGGFWPIFNRPQTESEITKLAKETNVPVPLRRRPLYEELEELRQASADGRPAAPPVYFGDTPPFRIWRQAVPNGDVQEITADKISIADLSAVGGGSILPATPEELLSHRSAFRAGGTQRPRSGSGSEAGPRHAPPRPAPTPPARQLCIWLWGRSRGRPLQSRRQRRFRARPQSKMAARCD
jgi:hypothetical protein